MRAPLLALALVSFGTLACRGPASVTDPRDAARIASDVRDWRRAAALWHELWVASGYQDAEAARAAAEALGAGGDAAGARALLAAHLARVPGDAAAWTDLGALELGQGAHEAARPAFERALALAPGDMRAAVALAQLYRLAGDDARALATVEAASRAAAGAGGAGQRGAGAEATALAPTGWLELARASLRLGRLEDAVLGFRGAYSALAPEPDDVAALADAVRVAGAAGARHDGDVLAWLARAAEDAPSRGDLQRHRAALLVARGRASSAVDPARAALSIDPGDVEAAALAVLALRAAGRDGEADTVLRHTDGLDLTPAERRRLAEVTAPPAEPSAAEPGTPSPL